MRVAVVFFGGPRRNAVAELARGVGEGIERLGHHVELIDAERDVNHSLTPFQFIAIGTTSTSFFGGKVPGNLAEWLSQAGMVSGKKSFAFIASSPFGAQKALSRLMNTMEREGLFIRYSDILRSRNEALLVGSRLKIE